jgi:non-specific serine/threonine protein kinase
LVEKITDGMMGPVFRGLDTLSGAQVAIKILRPEKFVEHPELESQFRMEGEALRELNHPNIVHFSDFFAENGTHFLVMEYIPGGSLFEYLEAQPLPLDRVLEIGLDLADALARAHRLGIIHRDVKPQNILLATDGTPRLSDFGVAYYMRRPRITGDEMAGTIAYMPPESIESKPVDERTDIWSLGVVLFEMLAGRLPFTGKNIAELINQILTAPLPNLRELRPDLPTALYRLVELMLIKEAENRIPSVRLVGAALEAIRNGQEAILPSPGRRKRAGLGPGIVPEPATSFIGRKREQLEIVTLLDLPGGNVVTLTGPGGVGKTRLAIHTALQLQGRYNDGIIFVDLAPITAPEMVISRIAKALNIRDAGDRSLEEEIYSFFRGKYYLLILDNFEQVISAATVVSDMHANVPELDILVTSREPLRLMDERVYQVQPLSLPDLSRTDASLAFSTVESMDLFMQRGTAARPGLTLTAENARDIAEICVQLDGLPLAIELAAARTNILPPQYLLQELRDVFKTLTGGPRDTVSRHQTLRAAIDWSYNLLTNEEKIFFNRLSVFRGGRTLAAIKEVCLTGLSLNMLTGLESLISKNLVLRGEDVEKEPRFILLETIQEYGRLRLEDSGEEQILSARHAHYFANLVDQIIPELRGAEQERFLNVLRTEYDNIRAALSWTLSEGNTELGLRLVAALVDFWYYEGAEAEGKKWMDKALAVIEQAPPKLQTRLLNGASLMAFIRGEHQQGQRWNEQALDIARHHNNKEGAAWALFWMSAHATGSPAAHEEGISLCEKALDLFHEIDDKYGLAWGYNQIGELSRLMGRYENAEDAYKQSLAICRQTGNLRREAIALVNLGYVNNHQGNHLAAEKSILEGLALLYHLKLLHHSTIALGSLGGPVAAQGEARRATTLLGAADAAFKRMAIPQQPADQMEIESYLNEARASLNAEDFQEAWSTGQAMSMEEAVAFAFLKEAGDQLPEKIN